MTPITVRDVEGMLARVKRSLASMDVDTNSLYVQMGSRTNGVAYRLYGRAGDFGGVSGEIMPDGFLGTTKREAYDTLHAIAQTLEWVNDHVNLA